MLLTSILRNLLKHKGFTAINITGLSLGLTGALILFLVVRFETGFNQVPDGERIFRLVATVDRFGDVRDEMGVPYPFADAFRADFGDLEAMSIADNNIRPKVVTAFRDDGERVRFEEQQELLIVEPDYFAIFPRRWLAGDPTALSQPNTIVVSESVARKYFNTTEVMGKSLLLNGQPHEIRGVVDDAIRQSDLRFNLFLPFVSAADRPGWGSIGSQTQYYVKLPAGMAAADVEARLIAFNEKHLEEEDAKATVRRLQPLAELHFDNRYSLLSGSATTWQELASLALVGVLLVVISCINFVNLNTALAVNRAREIGVRKVLGSSRGRIIAQYLAETALVTGISLGFVLILTELTLPSMSVLLEKPISLNLASDPTVWAFLSAALVVVSLASGLYPALVISGFRPIDAIYHQVRMKTERGVTLRKALVATQFIITQMLIIGALVISGQMDYFRSKDLGFSQTAVVQTPVPNPEEIHQRRLSALLNAETSILSHTFSNSGAASNGTWNTFLRIDGEPGTEPFQARTQFKNTDRNYLTTYGMTLLAGEDFGPVDSLNGLIVNEQAVKATGFSGPYDAFIGTRIRIMGGEYPVQGVVQDFHTTSLRDPLYPVVIMTRHTRHVLAVKIDMSRRQQALDALEAAWTEVFPDNLYTFNFLEDTVAQFYNSEQVASKVLNMFTLLTILIGSLGLFGLVSHVAVQRTKEIGIRKVMGAESRDIVLIFAREFGVLLLVSFVIAAPTAWWLMNQWLEDFAYRITPGAGILLAGLAASILIAAATVAYTTWRAAVANPVDSLRYE